MNRDEQMLRWLSAQCADALMEIAGGLPVIAVAVAYHLGYNEAGFGTNAGMRQFLQSITKDSPTPRPLPAHVMREQEELGRR